MRSSKPSLDPSEQDPAYASKFEGEHNTEMTVNGSFKFWVYFKCLEVKT